MWHKNCFILLGTGGELAGLAHVTRPHKRDGSAKDQMSKMKSMHAGFSLVELMIVIAVLGIMSAIAIPGFIKWLPDYYLKSAARDLRASFQLARITAIKTGTNGTIIFNQSVDGETYDYVVFEDANNDLAFDSSETVVKKVKWADYHSSISTNSNDFTAVGFRSNGIPVGLTSNGTVSIKNTDNSEADITVSIAGNIKIALTIH